VKIELGTQEVAWNLSGSLDEWLEQLPLPAASALANSLESGEAKMQDGRVLVSAGVIACWSEAVARACGLPPNSPFGFDIRLSGVMGKPGASISVRWLMPGKTVPARDVECDGLWLVSAGKTYRVPSPAFAVLAMVDSFNQVPDGQPEEQFRHWSRIRAELGEDQSAALTDGFLRSFRVVTASSLTFNIEIDQDGDVQIAPVLLTTRRAEEGEDLTHVRALTEADEAVFPKRLDQLREGTPAFPISNGTYVIADESLQQALKVVRKLRQSPPDVRKRAAMYPEAVFREMMGLAEGDPTVFVETEKYAERVRDVGEWVVPVLPWIKIDPQEWGLPISCGVLVGGVNVPLNEQSLAAAVESMRTALKGGDETSKVGHEDIPATKANLAILEQLQKSLQNTTKPAAGKSPGEKPQADAPQVLIIETNFDEASFNNFSVGKRPGSLGLPDGLKTAPKAHQEKGIEWLQRHWLEGSRGAMLCDDMGLGKTFQALAFCLWLRELMDKGKVERKPLLIVAPVGLLRNWEAEMAEHLMEPGLGSLVRAYGDNLKGLRRGSHVIGNAHLDTSKLAGADVVLANYEAVSEYQFGFCAVEFAAVILDEAQKIKSPKARMTHAAKALNAGFVVAMTGTPVENRLADLWCIADTAQPGALADLKDFSARYETEGADVAVLRNLVWHDEADDKAVAPRMLLRRLKSDKLEGLPKKFEHVISKHMPARQAQAYERALAMGEFSGPGGTLGTIHALRRISLHPSLVEGGVKDDELKFEESARMTAMIEILDSIASSGEKALMFLESLDLQDSDQLPLLIQRRYGLPRLPMVINGQVSTEARQKKVDLFQREKEFDVMLLSPKAGGVGLTLTAANHVIHLSRWWNPAVEDQCSDRVYRIGQTKPVHIYYPLAVMPDAEEFSFDMQLQQLMNRKRKLAQNLLAAPAFDKDDYASLLSGTQRGVQVRKAM
jgi:hypothetical protein